MSSVDKSHDQEAGTMKRKLWSVLGVVLMMVFTLTACSSSDETPLSSKKAITAYSLAGVAGTINETGKTIAVTVPFGTNVTALAATFTTTGKKVRVGSTVQESGTTTNNFTSPVDYKVTAANGSSVTYTVTVTVGPSSAKAITAFSFASPVAVGTITESTHSIAVTVPACTNVTALVATFTTTGASVKVGSTVQTSATTANDFTSPVVYTVTAADASAQNYTVAVTVASGGCWTAKTAFGGTARRGAVGFSIGSKGYIGTGKDATVYYKDFWEYDSVANTWTQKADFGLLVAAARSDAAGFSIGTKGYIGTGITATGFTDDFWEYDPAGNTWNQMTTFGGTKRGSAVGFSIGTKGYIGTGEDGAGYTKDFYEYDPATGVGGTWTKKADFGGTARKDAVGILIGTKGYIGTGLDSTGYKKDFWEYTPAAGAALGTWTQKADFGGVARSSAVGFGSSCSNGYIGTGGTTCDFYKDFWEYDPTANTWTQRTDFGGTERDSAVGFMIGGMGYVGTGYDGLTSSYFKDFWQYEP
jgi:hypothetical protein